MPEPVGPVTSTMPLGLYMIAAEFLERLLVHADLGQVERNDRTVQDPHDHAFAEHRRQHADTQVDRVAADGQFDPTVLRQTPLGNVQVRHHFDASRDRKRQVTWRRHQFVQHTVRFDANPKLVFERLEVNVAGVFFDRGEQNHVEQLANRRAVGHRFHTGQFDWPFPGGQPFGRFGQLGVCREVVDDALQTLGRSRVVLGQAPFPGRLRWRRPY